MGSAHFSFTRSDWGRAGFKAVVSAPSSDRIILTDASPGRQRLLGGNFKEHATGSSNYTVRPSRPVLSYECGENCDGNVKLTFQAKNPRGSAPVRQYFKVDGQVFFKFDVKGGTSVTRHVVLKMADGKVVIPGICSLNSSGKCATRVIWQKPFAPIVCPPWAKANVEVTMTAEAGCDCASGIAGTAVVTMTVPDWTIRYYTGTVSVGGQSKTKSLTPGQNTSFSFPSYHPGDEVKLSVQGLQRSFAR